MKIITECIIDIKSLQIIEEKSYNYVGPITLCKGSGGGGGGSGKIEYPAHITTFHGNVLGTGALTAAELTMDSAMVAALGASPWVGQAAYDPDGDIVDLLAAPNTLQTLVTLLSTGTSLDTLISNVLDESRIDDVVTEYTADLDAHFLANVVPRFEAGMRDINAVVGSAFPIGRAILEENQDRQVARFSAELHNKAFSDDAIKVIGLKLEYQRVVSAMLLEGYRMKIVAKKEQTDLDMKIDEFDAEWDLNVFQFGANLLAAPGGGTSNPHIKTPSTTQSVIGGAMSGAAAGTMISPGWGTAIGAALGAAAGYYS